MAKVLGQRALASNEVVYTLDVNQWIATYLAAIRRQDRIIVKTNAKSGPRVLAYAQLRSSTLQGKKVVVGSSTSILKTFAHVLYTDHEIGLYIPKEVSMEWFRRQMTALNRKGALLFDQTVWTEAELRALAAVPGRGMPDWEDESVYQTARNLDSDAILGLDKDFMGAAEHNGMKWITANDALSLMPA